MGQDPAEHLHPLPHPQRLHQLLHLLHVQLLLQGGAPLQAGEKAQAQRDGDKVQLQLIHLPSSLLCSVTASLTVCSQRGKGFRLYCQTVLLNLN